MFPSIVLDVCRRICRPEIKEQEHHLKNEAAAAKMGRWLLGKMPPILMLPCGGTIDESNTPDPPPEWRGSD